MFVVALTVGTAALSLGQLRAIRAAPSPAAPRLLSLLKRAAAEERVSLAAREAAPGSWEGELARAVAASSSELERTDALSEAVGELAGQYAARARWSAAALRLEVLGGVLAAAWALIAGANEAAAASLIASLVAAGGLAAADRRARELERDQRANADRLVELLLGVRPARTIQPAKSRARGASG